MYECDTIGSEKYLIICARQVQQDARDESHRRVSCFYPKGKKNLRLIYTRLLIGNYVLVTSIFIFSLSDCIGAHNFPPAPFSSIAARTGITRNCLNIYDACMQLCEAGVTRCILRTPIIIDGEMYVSGAFVPGRQLNSDNFNACYVYVVL